MDNTWLAALEQVPCPWIFQIKWARAQGNLKLPGDVNLKATCGIDMGRGPGQSRPWWQMRTDEMDAQSRGAVGQAIIRLPKSIGVARESASGGIGAITTGGLHKNDGQYVNDAYGKSRTRCM